MKSSLARSLNNLGAILFEERKLADAKKILDEAKGIFEKLRQNAPEVFDHRAGLAMAVTNLGLIASEVGKNRDAIEFLEQARELYQGIIKDEPNTEYRDDLVRTLLTLGVLYQKQNKNKHAATVYDEASELIDILLKDRPASRYLKKNLALILYDRGLIHIDDRQEETAKKLFLRARSLLEELVKAEPANDHNLSTLAATRRELARLLTAPEERNKELTRALADAGKALALNPPQVRAWKVYRTRALVLTNLERYGEAADDWAKLTELGPEPEQMSARVKQAECFARAGRAVDAMAEVERLARDARELSARYSQARIAALSVGAILTDRTQPLPRRERLAGIYAGRAMLWLREIHDGGGFKSKEDRETLQMDKALDPLRNREAFQEFTAQVLGQ